jgi:hypothetical protein
MSPCSTAAIFVGSIFVLLLVALVTTAPTIASTTTIDPIHQIRRFFFLEFPFATSPPPYECYGHIRLQWAVGSKMFILIV